MSEPQANNDELQNYEIPITDLTSDGNNPILSPSTGADVITAVGGVTPERFWMVFMVIISIALGLFIFIGGGYLANEISSKNNEIIQLKKELKECPEETLNRIKEEQLKFQELKEIVKLDSAKIDNALTKKKQRLKSLKEIEKNIEP
jgi:hypothetical protein